MEAGPTRARGLLLGVCCVLCAVCEAVEAGPRAGQEAGVTLLSGAGDQSQASVVTTDQSEPGNTGRGRRPRGDARAMTECFTW